MINYNVMGVGLLIFSLMTVVPLTFQWIFGKGLSDG